MFSCGETKPEEAKKDIIKGCTEGAAGHPAYEDIPKSKIKKYCECAASELIDNSGFSIEEIEKMNESQRQTHMVKAALDCVDILLE